MLRDAVGKDNRAVVQVVGREGGVQHARVRVDAHEAYAFRTEIA